MPLANGSAACGTRRATAVAGGAAWKCCARSCGLKVDSTMEIWVLCLVHLRSLAMTSTGPVA